MTIDPKKTIRFATVTLLPGSMLALSNIGIASAAQCNRDKCDLIAKYVNPTINLFSVSFGLIAVISLILGSINYATSEGDPQKASKAKQRIFNTLFAVVAYMFLYSFLQFLVPGGLFKR